MVVQCGTGYVLFSMANHQIIILLIGMALGMMLQQQIQLGQHQHLDQDDFLILFFVVRCLLFSYNLVRRGDFNEKINFVRKGNKDFLQKLILKILISLLMKHKIFLRLNSYYSMLLIHNVSYLQGTLTKISLVITILEVGKNIVSYIKQNSMSYNIIGVQQNQLSKKHNNISLTTTIKIQALFQDIQLSKK